MPRPLPPLPSHFSLYPSTPIEMMAVPRFLFSREYAVRVRRVGRVPGGSPLSITSEEVGAIRFPVLPGARGRVTLKNLDLTIRRTRLIPAAFALTDSVVFAQAHLRSVFSQSWIIKHDGVTYQFLLGLKDPFTQIKRCELHQDDRYVGSVKLHAGFVRYKASMNFPHEHPYEFVMFLT